MIDGQSMIILTHIYSPDISTNSLSSSFLVVIHQYPGYGSAIFSVLFPEPSYLVTSSTDISNAVISFDFKNFFKEPTSRSSFKIRYMEQGIHPAIVEAAYCSMVPFTEYELDAFYNELLAYRKTIVFTEQQYPFQVDGILYPDPAVFKVIKTAFYYEASQYPGASPQYVDSIGAARVNPHAPQEAWLHYQSLTPELSQQYLEIGKYHFLTNQPLTIDEYIKQLNVSKLPPGFLEHCQHAANRTLEALYLKTPEPPLPIYLSKNIQYPFGDRAEMLECLHETPVDLSKVPADATFCATHAHFSGIPKGAVQYCTLEGCYLCEKDKDCRLIKLESWLFPFIIQLESKLFLKFKEWCPFFYEFIKYRVDFDPYFGRKGYYLLLLFFGFVHLYFAYLMFKIFRFIQGEHRTNYYTNKWHNGLNKIRTYDDLKRSGKFGWLSNLVNDLIMVDFNIIKYIPKLLYNKRDIEVSKKKFLQFGKEIYRQYKKWYLPAREVPIMFRLSYIMSFGVYKIPTIKFLYNQLQALIIVLYMRRAFYIFIISIFVFIFNILLRFIFIHMHIFRVSKYLLFFCLYHLIGFKMGVQGNLSFYIIQLCIKWYNLVAYLLFLDGHVLAYPFFNFWPTYINSFEIDTYKDSPRLYPASLKKIIFGVMPMQYSNLHAPQFTISLIWNLFCLILNFSVLLPLSFCVEKLIPFLFRFGFWGFHIYFKFIKFYRKILVKLLLVDLISFLSRIKYILFYLALFSLAIIFKYILLIFLIVFFVYFCFFYCALRLRTNFGRYLQQCFNLFLIILGGLFVYSGELIRYFITFFLYIILSFFFRIKYILFFGAVLYLGVTTNFIYFFVCRGLEDLDETIMVLMDMGIAGGFPLRQWWLPCFDPMPIADVLYAPSSWIPWLARRITPPNALRSGFIKHVSAFAMWFPALFPTGFQVWFSSYWPGPMLLRPYLLGAHLYFVEVRFSESLLYAIDSYYLNLGQGLGDHKIYGIRSQLFTHIILLDIVMSFERRYLINVHLFFLTCVGGQLFLICTAIYYCYIGLLYGIGHIPLIADSALTFLSQYPVKYTWRLLGIYYWLKFNIFFYFPYICLFNGSYLMPSLCGYMLTRVYYIYLLPLGFALPSLGLIKIASFSINLAYNIGHGIFGCVSFNICFPCYLIGCIFMEHMRIAYSFFSMQEFYLELYDMYIDNFQRIFMDISYFMGNQCYEMGYGNEAPIITRGLIFIYDWANGIVDYIFSSVRIDYNDMATKLSISDTSRYTAKFRIRAWRRRFRLWVIVGRLFGSQSGNDIVLSPFAYRFFDTYEFVVDDLEGECWRVVFVA